MSLTDIRPKKPLAKEFLTDGRGCDTESTLVHAPWTVCGMIPSVDFGRQVPAVSEKQHRQLI